MATWEVKSDELWLIHIEANIAGIGKVGLCHFFPEQSAVKAVWFTGKIRIPVGELLHYQHIGYASEYEGDMTMNIEKGRLVSRSIRDNRSGGRDDRDWADYHPPKRHWLMRLMGR